MDLYKPSEGTLGLGEIHSEQLWIFVGELKFLFLAVVWGSYLAQIMSHPNLSIGSKLLVARVKRGRRKNHTEIVVLMHARHFTCTSEWVTTSILEEKYGEQVEFQLFVLPWKASEQFVHFPQFIQLIEDE
ncbi:hypothetical protein RUM44_011483 [Polyplax serrata]|uniref:Uncharacterized protein n=1 Tax=Polyplax serrata TaxID=468196 RepID=A0ABR1AQ83_POLSC